MFIARKGDAIRWYIDSCPHTGVPLNWSLDELTTENSRLIICSIHGALFERGNGYCSFGSFEGDYLEPVPLEVRGGLVVIGNGLDVEDKVMPKQEIRGSNRSAV